MNISELIKWENGLALVIVVPLIFFAVSVLLVLACKIFDYIGDRIRLKKKAENKALLLTAEYYLSICDADPQRYPEDPKLVVLRFMGGQSRIMLSPPELKKLKRIHKEREALRANAKAFNAEVEIERAYRMEYVQEMIELRKILRKKIDALCLETGVGEAEIVEYIMKRDAEFLESLAGPLRSIGESGIRKHQSETIKAVKEYFNRKTEGENDE